MCSVCPGRSRVRARQVGNPRLLRARCGRSSGKEAGVREPGLADAPLARLLARRFPFMRRPSAPRITGTRRIAPPEGGRRYAPASLRCSSGWPWRRNSLRELRSLRSDICAKSDHEARCARGPPGLRFSAPPTGDAAGPGDPRRGHGSGCRLARAPSPAGRERVGVRVGMVLREPPSPRPSPASGRGREPCAGMAVRKEDTPSRSTMSPERPSGHQP
jgi:hypothetical protein